MQKTIERQGGMSEPHVKHYPDVRGGTCERCGVINPNDEAINQYKYCEHYRGMQLGCSYCPGSTDQNEVIRRSVLKITDSPDNASELVIVCGAFECADKHLKRFQRNR